MSTNHQIDSLEDLGDAIQDIIDSAVRSQNYQKLNKTVSDVVNRAVDYGVDAVRRSVDNSHPLRRTDTHVNRNIYSSKISSMNSTPKVTVEPKQNNLPVLYRNPSGKLSAGIAKTVGGGILTFCSGTSLALYSVLNSVFAAGSLFNLASAICAVGIGGGVWLLSSGIRTIGRMERFQKYVRTLGQKTYCTVEQLARSVGKSEKYVRKELPAMIQDGLFLEGHMDDEGKSLITSDETFAHYQQAQLQLLERQRQEAEEKRKQTSDPKRNPQVREVLNRGNAFIREIRRCNDAIPGQEMTAKISRMENIIQKIFERAEEHPEIVPDLKKMMDYYLPMTVKLLNAYADMDAQPIQGQTIQSSKREIEATLDTLNLAFEKLLDSVFRDTALDVSSDISVLQTLLAQEGLTEDELMKMKKDK